jgi:hypothetical protein
MTDQPPTPQPWAPTVLDALLHTQWKLMRPTFQPWCHC